MHRRANDSRTIPTTIRRLQPSRMAHLRPTRDANHEMLQRGPLKAPHPRPNVLGYEVLFPYLPWRDEGANVSAATGGYVPEQSFIVSLEKRLRCQDVNL